MQKIVIADPARGLDGLELVEGPAAPDPGPGEVRLRLIASSLNFHDYLVASGAVPVAPGRIPLADAAGVVTAVGRGVGDVREGDLLVSCFFPDWQDGPPATDGFARTPGDGIDGFARSEVTLPATWFTRAPAGWSPEEAATITTAGVTAWRSLRDMQPGETLLALGTGGVSIQALAIAKALGGRVIHTTSSPAKAERLRALGADEVIDYRKTPDWAARVMELTGGRGVEHVMEVGGAGSLAQSIGAIAIGGRIHLVGVLTGLAGEIPAARLIARQATISGMLVGSRVMQAEYVAAAERLGLRPTLDRSFPLADLAAAFRYQEAGRHFGKVGVALS